MAETAYPHYTPSSLESSPATLIPVPAVPHSQVNLNQIRTAFEVASISDSNGASTRPDYPYVHGAPPHLQGGAYTDVYPSPSFGAFAQNEHNQINGGPIMYGYGPGPAVASFQGPHQTQLSPDPNAGSFSHPVSPYLGVSPNPGVLPFGSPTGGNSNSQLPSPSGRPGSYNGSNYSAAYDGAPSPNPYNSLLSSPNPYSDQTQYGAFGGFSGVSQSSSYMMPGGVMVNGIASPGLPSMSPTFGGLSGFPLMSGQMGPAVSPSQAGRTVYVGNLPADASVDELLSQVRFGPIDSVKILPEKSCAFISFLDPTTASAFHSDALMRKIRLHEQDLKIGWGKPSAVSATVIMAVQQSGATRNVYLGNLPESVTEQTLRDDLSRFGPIDQVKIVRDKNIGFVHFLSIATAIKVVQSLATEPDWVGRRVAWGKDRCAYVPKNQHQQQQHNMAAAARGTMAANYGGFGGMPFAPGFDSYGREMGGLMGGADPNAAPGNRTVYLGNVHPETTTEEICNTIRGGILQQVRYIADKHICFVTFVDAQCALAFYQTATYQGIALHNRRLKVGWGKHSGPPSPGISMVVQSGGSRNVYVGNIENFDFYTEDKLRHDFGEYGEIELINTLREKQCAFVNFTNIASSIKAIESIKSHPDYAHLKIAYGKDRAGNPPRNVGFGSAFSPRTQYEGFGDGNSPLIDNFDDSPLGVVEYHEDEGVSTGVTE